MEGGGGVNVMTPLEVGYTRADKNTTILDSYSSSAVLGLSRDLKVSFVAKFNIHIFIKMEISVKRMK